MKRAEERSAGLSIRWKLAVYLSLFTALVLIITWVFQIYLLDVFYEQIKKQELKNTAEELIENLETENLELVSYHAAVEGTMSVMVCQWQEGKPVPVVNVDATGKSGVMLSEEMLLGLFRLAETNGGSYLGRFFGAEEVQGNRYPSFPMDWWKEEGKEDTRNIRLMYLRLVEGKSGASYLVLTDAGLQPLDSTVQILKTQFIWIAGLLLLCAAILVLLLYRHISAPLVDMNRAAKQLALGKYDVEFSGKGYSETRELAQTLNYASHELSRADRLQKELIANISHDLRTPLTMIKGYTEIMRDLPGENTPENMQVVIDETTRLSELVGDLLDLSRIQSGTRKTEPEIFDLTAALQETILRCDTFIRHKGYKIRVEADCEVNVYADRGMILQVLYNLINNAINYTGEDLTVTVKQTFEAGKVRISVSDSGEGIEPDQMPLIWDRYYKVDKVHRRAVVGTGLGLSITKEILELHHAAYGVSSTVGEGSTFWFELPASLVSPKPILSSKED